MIRIFPEADRLGFDSVKNLLILARFFTMGHANMYTVFQKKHPLILLAIS